MFARSKKSSRLPMILFNNFNPMNEQSAWQKNYLKYLNNIDNRETPTQEGWYQRMLESTRLYENAYRKREMGDESGSQWNWENNMLNDMRIYDNPEGIEDMNGYSREGKNNLIWNETLGQITSPITYSEIFTEIGKEKLGEEYKYTNLGIDVAKGFFNSKDDIKELANQFEQKDDLHVLKVYNAFLSLTSNVLSAPMPLVGDMITIVRVSTLFQLYLEAKDEEKEFIKTQLYAAILAFIINFLIIKKITEYLKKILGPEGNVLEGIVIKVENEDSSDKDSSINTDDINTDDINTRIEHAHSSLKGVEGFLLNISILSPQARIYIGGLFLICFAIRKILDIMKEKF